MKYTRLGMLGLLIGGIIVVATVQPAVAIDVVNDSCSGVNNAVCDAQDDDVYDLIGNIISVLLFIIGVIAVIMIVISGLKYVTSNGDTNQVTSAKNTILYSVIGLIVAIMAYGIVEFVIDALD